MKKINIVVSTDDNFAQHATIALMSACEKCSSDYTICAYILDGDICAEKKQKMTESLRRYECEVTFVNVDTKKYKLFYTSYQYTAAIYYRLDIPNLLAKDVEKCIYVDCDVIFMDDVSKLWNTPLHGHPIGAVEDIGISSSKRSSAAKKAELGLENGSDYFNSGMVVMDLKQWREQDMSSKAMKLAAENEFRSHDQDILNKLFMNNWCHIDLRWNVIPPITYMYPKLLFSKKNVCRSFSARINMGILHYAGRYKAWEYKRYKVFNAKYYELLSKSAFADMPMPQLSKQNIGRNFTKEIVRIYIANILQAPMHIFLHFTCK